MTLQHYDILDELSAQDGLVFRRKRELSYPRRYKETCSVEYMHPTSELRAAYAEQESAYIGLAWTECLKPTSSVVRCAVPETSASQRKPYILMKYQTSQAKYNQGAHDLPELRKGDVVRVRTNDARNSDLQKAEVQAKVNIRSYEVKIEDGRKFRRNHKGSI